MNLNKKIYRNQRYSIKDIINCEFKLLKQHLMGKNKIEE